MLTNKSAFLQRINLALTTARYQKRSAQKWASEFKVEKEQPEEDISVSAKNEKLIKQLERKIEGLECQVDQLLFLCNSLVDKIPDMIANILLCAENQDADMTWRPSAIPGTAKSLNEINCPNKSGPCPTRRERDVLDLLMKGLCAKEIAIKLFISESTVITHKKNLKEKFNAKNSVELISKARNYMNEK